MWMWTGKGRGLCGGLSGDGGWGVAEGSKAGARGTIAMIALPVLSCRRRVRSPPEAEIFTTVNRVPRFPCTQPFFHYHSPIVLILQKDENRNPSIHPSYRRAKIKK